MQILKNRVPSYYKDLFLLLNSKIIATRKEGLEMFIDEAIACLALAKDYQAKLLARDIYVASMAMAEAKEERANIQNQAEDASCLWVPE